MRPNFSHFALPWSLPHLRTWCTMRFGSTAKVLLKCKLKYYRISECGDSPEVLQVSHVAATPLCKSGWRLGSVSSAADVVHLAEAALRRLPHTSCTGAHSVSATFPGMEFQHHAELSTCKPVLHQPPGCSIRCGARRRCMVQCRCGTCHAAEAQLPKWSGVFAEVPGVATRGYLAIFRLAA